MTWTSPPRRPSLDDGDVHVWRAAADRAGCRLDELRRTLSADELARAERFSFRRDRDRFIVRRGLLRRILGSYLAIDPARLQFAYGARGKPALDTQYSTTGVRFNVSRSSGLVLCVVARGREVGVDLEQIRPAIAREGIPERFFSPREVAALRALPVDAQPEAFFSCWTRKEAYVKARGEGLALHLDSFDVSLVPGEPAALLRTAGDATEASRWSLHALAPGRGYVAALALEGWPRRLTCWQWTE